MTEKKTISEELDGKLLEEHRGSVVFDSPTGIFTFEDGSQATAIIRYEKFESALSKSLSTMSTKPVRYFMDVKPVRYWKAK